MDAQQVITYVQLSLHEKFPDIPFDRAEKKELKQPRLEYRLVAVDFTRERSDRFVRVYTLEVRYVPAAGHYADEQIEDLFEALETIGTGEDLCRASELRWDTEDGVPRIRVNYPVRTVRSAVPGILMNTMDQHVYPASHISK
ncbi:phage tail terminator family protein [Paenibacillus shenyangensis]|uniref:phage tail terminator family protein n=1 Tax=Paenibacillus sp. A9 TaxID=1284352 RepID=UPI00036F74B5|nr:hypothetical protein [Paenibacillus sp. A9]